MHIQVFLVRAKPNCCNRLINMPNRITQIVAVTHSANNLQRNIFAHVTNTNTVWRRHFDDFNRCLSLCSEYFLIQKMNDAVNGGDAVHQHLGKNIYKIVAGAKIDSSEFQQMSIFHFSFLLAGSQQNCTANKTMQR